MKLPLATVASFLAIALLSPGCATAERPATGAAPAATQAAPAASQRLRALFAKSDEASLERNPFEALSRGDTRFADRYVDRTTDAYLAAERTAAEAELAELATIDREALSADDRVAYDVFKWQRSLDLRGLQPDILSLTVVRPIDHFNGFHTNFAELSSGESIAPYKTVADYEAGLKRIDGFVAQAGNVVARLREGLASGVVQPKLVMNNVVGQLDAMIAEGVEGSSFYRPTTRVPAEIPAADQARLKAAYAESIRAEILPALTRLRDFIRTDYLPRARDGVGMRDMKGGPELYRYLVELRTTAAMDPEAVHQTGLREVARIRAEMEKVKAQVGFKGTLKQFFDHLRTDPKFKVATKQQLTDGYYAIGKRVDARIGELFSTLPKSRLEVRPVPPLTEKGAAGGSYEPGTPDGSRPGVFYFNTYDLPSRTTPGMETLYLHEGAPGHHFQISLAQENTNLPNFMRFGGNNAFVEGWALYVQDLGPALGLYTDPYQYFGYLDSELFRAARLVVDTGIHTKGWTRDQSIQYMLDNTSRGRTNLTAEVERYIAWPGQALSYKIGQLKIRELRARAERELGNKFDVRDFHHQVLMTGALPLAVLEDKIDRWIAERKKG
jgi:uncharacterized protein (DUF885 family)